MKRLNNWLVPLGTAAAVSAISVTVWLSWTMLMDDSPRSQIVATVRIGSPLMMKYYSSIGELSDDADAVVVGSVSGVAQTGMDRGRDSSLITPIPYTLYAVEVLEVLKGEADETIYVYISDPESSPRAPLSRLREGETVIIYLNERSAELVPTITVTDVLYVTVAWDNAVFDILSPGDVGAVGRVNDDVVAIPRGTGASMFAEGTTFTFSELRDAIETGSEEIGPVGSVNN